MVFFAHIPPLAPSLGAGGPIGRSEGGPPLEMAGTLNGDWVAIPRPEVPWLLTKEAPLSVRPWPRGLRPSAVAAEAMGATRLLEDWCRSIAREHRAEGDLLTYCARTSLATVDHLKGRAPRERLRVDIEGRAHELSALASSWGLVESPQLNAWIIAFSPALRMACLPGPLSMLPVWLWGLGHLAPVAILDPNPFTYLALVQLVNARSGTLEGLVASGDSAC